MRAKKRSNAPRSQLSEAEEVQLLSRRVVEEAPAPGTQPSAEGPVSFEQMPISSRTVRGLSEGGWTTPTEVQYAALQHALAGRDILGAAKTGSGKTLAFLIPLVEKLYRERWSLQDGLGALVISPTRELALQIFQVLRTVGKRHTLSAGLITGGKKEFREEQLRVVRMNVLIATPGRLLQHLEQTPGFDVSSLQVLVLDEADRILDMGFRDQLNAILSYLPTERQTMLFSATQTKSVKDLARLSMKDAEYISVHAEDPTATPKQLVQNYIVCEIQHKLDILFSFLKSHLKSKIIVFFSSCAQVRFVHECFRGLQPGIPLMALHGKVKQAKRTLIYFDFLNKQSACLFATDIASRGLDFPAVDWVVQVDAPEDAAMYIHRVGRTARYKSGGRALMLVTPSEEPGMINVLQESGITLKRLSVNPSRTVTVTQRAASIVASDPECKALAKKAFMSYLRSVVLMPNKDVFKVEDIPLKKFSESLGLPTCPPVKFLEEVKDRDGLRKSKNKSRALDKLKKQIQAEKEAKRRAKLGLPAVDDAGSSERKKAEDDEDALTAMARQEGDSGSEDDSQGDSDSDDDDGDDDDDDFLTIKKVHHFDEPSSEPSEPSAGAVPTSKASKKRKRMKIKLDRITSKVVYDEEGNPVMQEWADQPATKEAISQHIQSLKRQIDEVRDEDKKRDQERIREKHRKKRLRELEENAVDAGVGGVQLAAASDAESDGSEDDGSDDGSDDGGESYDSGSDASDDVGGTLEDQERAALALLQGR